MPAFKVLLTTSGTGSRLGELTKTTNKALVPINGKPAITYIIDRYAAEVEFVVTLGYLGEQVREALTRLYPQRAFHFVQVDLFQGPGSSLGYSMLAAESMLQEPFVFHCCDTIVLDDVPAPDGNWIGGFELEDASQYRTLKVVGDEVVGLNDKGEPGFNSIHVGLVGFQDYASFWKHLHSIYEGDPLDQTLNDTFVINGMLQDKVHFKFLPLKTWYDTGNPSALARTTASLT